MSNNLALFRGSYVALITPFRNNQVDEDSLRELVNWQIEQGTHGLVPVGTTGEATTLTEAEHKRVIAITVEAAAGRVPVLAGAGSNNPREALNYARSAQESGADGLLCVAGYYNKPSQDGLFEHFKFIHDQVELPLVIYNIPPRTVVDVKPETMARLAQLPRVVGVKDATMELARVSRERALIDKPFNYFSGEDITALAYNAMGGTGCISVAANIAPALCAQLQNACSNNDFETALQLHERLVPLFESLFIEPNPAGIKYALSLTGRARADVRLPMMPVGESTGVRIRQALEYLALL